MGNFWERHPVNFVASRSLVPRLPGVYAYLLIFSHLICISLRSLRYLRGTRMIQIGGEKYLKIKKSTAKSGQKLPMNSFSMLCNFLTGHY